ncbi:prephenate dehydratase [Halalkalibacter akibai]|uniref:Prephenate dehydratase n=1 Tax=Halalkalibacter akibai (strain ATCC 43226 / DSM 21942 / CIP 109018 / JCM 9157 / 1139) TaxID=1236973 RepID=W4QSL2_HALA3|nr:prephenate dehydratase [Halalkalibacter akibai]GAE35115.1 prephenate dehydratase [Halalkalibacter akibai JCM 9157]
MKIGYLGPKGTFTEMAAKGLFEKGEFIPFRTIPSCMDAVKAGKVDVAVVPIENAIEGSVNMTLDYLIHKQRLPIVGGITVPIEQHLLVHPNRVDIKTIDKIVSHPHAIAQCHDFLLKQYPDAEWEYMNSTGAAADFVHNHPELSVAAIANELAAKEYGLNITHSNIHDFSNNKTSFVVLSNQPVQVNSVESKRTEDKTMLMVTLPADYSGALHQVLSAFAWRKLNLTKIESRPTKTGLGNYFFIIDIEGLMDDVLIPGAMSEIKALGCGVELLGSFPVYSFQKNVAKIK